MKIRVIIHITGVLLAVLGVSMLVTGLLSFYYKEEDLFAFLSSGILSVAAGLVMFFFSGLKSEKMGIGHRTAFAIVTIGWFISCLAGALPYYFYARLPAVFYEDAPQIAAGENADTLQTSRPDCKMKTGLGHEFCSFTNAVFESVSGFTTTGATILEGGLWNDPHSRKGGLPHGILFWRALTHFFGGMGIIVFGIAILPLLGVGGMALFKAEVPGPVKDKMAPKVADTARLLWKVYAGMTFVEFLLLLMTGQGAYLSICHAFATMATGGFSPLSSSVETLNSPSSEWIITFFMLLAGMNFSLHFNSLRLKKITYFKDDEFKYYMVIGGGISVAIAFILWFRLGYHFEDGLRTSTFQTFSILTTTGFSSTDFALWGIGARMLLFLLFFVGGCSGSTGGGIKVVRLILMFRLAFAEMKRLIHPRGVIHARLSGNVVPAKIINSIAGFIALYFVIYLFSTAILALFGYDFQTSFTAVGATLGNIGPGFGVVGPAGNYNFFPDLLKWLEIFLMIAGRLELYSVIILFTPVFWRK